MDTRVSFFGFAAIGIVLLGGLSNVGAASFAALVIQDGGESPGSEVIEEYAVESPGVSVINSTTTTGSALGHIGTGTLEAQAGSLRSQVEGFLPLNLVSPSAVFAIGGYTDTVTFFSDELGPGEAGTLHLEFTIEGIVNIEPGSIGSLSFSLVNADFPDLSTAESIDSMLGEDSYANHSENYFDFASAVDRDYGGADPALEITLDVPVNNGSEITYGAVLLLSILGDGELDFSQTLTFTGATLSDMQMNSVNDASYLSNSGLSYGSFTPVPEPGALALILVGVAITMGRRKRFA